MTRFQTPCYVGPLFSHCGFRSWDFWLQPEAIHAVRHSLGKALGLGFAQYLGSGFPEDPTPADHETGLPGTLLPVAEFERIVVENCLAGNNELRLEAPGGRTLVFGIYDRLRTDEFRRKLQSYYPGIYKEIGFKKPIDS